MSTVADTAGFTPIEQRLYQYLTTSGIPPYVVAVAIIESRKPEQREAEPAFDFCPECGQPRNPPERHPTPTDWRLHEIQIHLANIEAKARTGRQVGAEDELLQLCYYALTEIASGAEQANTLASKTLEGWSALRRLR